MQVLTPWTCWDGSRPSSGSENIKCKTYDMISCRQLPQPIAVVLAQQLRLPSSRHRCPDMHLTNLEANGREVVVVAFVGNSRQHVFQQGLHFKSLSLFYLFRHIVCT